MKPNHNKKVADYYGNRDEYNHSNEEFEDSMLDCYYGYGEDSCPVVIDHVPAYETDSVSYITLPCLRRRHSIQGAHPSPASSEFLASIGHAAPSKSNNSAPTTPVTRRSYTAGTTSRRSRMQRLVSFGHSLTVRFDQHEQVSGLDTKSVESIPIHQDQRGVTRWFASLTPLSSSDSLPDVLSCTRSSTLSPPLVVVQRPAVPRLHCRRPGTGLPLPSLQDPYSWPCSAEKRHSLAVALATMDAAPTKPQRRMSGGRR